VFAGPLPRRTIGWSSFLSHGMGPLSAMPLAIAEPETPKIRLRMRFAVSMDPQRSIW
jgi:hypothetical protein